jgi:hypothetical protein
MENEEIVNGMGGDNRIRKGLLDTEVRTPIGSFLMA